MKIYKEKNTINKDRIMDLGQLFKVDYWWKLVLLCGILLSAAAMIFDIQFIERRYVLGLGLGMTFIGIGYWKAKYVAHEFVPGGMFKYCLLYTSYHSNHQSYMEPVLFLCQWSAMPC